MIAGMARAATTSDVFNAIAEPQRRRILELLRGGELPVSDVVNLLDLPQPSVSKHLRVLREVELVHVRGQGKQRLYRLEPRTMRPVHQWVGEFEQFWEGSFDRLEDYVQELKEQQQEEARDD
jgi:DNA-binding transcriptional ArsR family regulator